MRRSKVWAVLPFVLVALTAGCSDSDAYPNDQARIENALAEAGLESVSVDGSEEFGIDGRSSEVTVSYTTSGSAVPETDLRTVREVVWAQYPHRLESLLVYVTARSGSLNFAYTREELRAELGEQEYRDDDSKPPLSAGMIAGLGIGVLIGLAFITYSVVRIRSARGRDGPSRPGPVRTNTTWTPVPPQPAAAPWPSRTAEPSPEPSPVARTPAAPPVAPPPVKPPPVRHEPVRPSRRRSFEETQIALNNGWQWLIDLVPDPAPPRKRNAAYVDSALAEESGLPVAVITAARRARNDAIHRPQLINKATMDEAIAIIDKAAETIHRKRNGGAGDAG